MPCHLASCKSENRILFQFLVNALCWSEIDKSVAAAELSSAQHNPNQANATDREHHTSILAYLF